MTYYTLSDYHAIDHIHTNGDDLTWFFVICIFVNITVAMFIYFYSYKPFRSIVYLIPIHIGLILSCLSIFVLLPVDLSKAMYEQCMGVVQERALNLSEILECKIPFFLPQIPEIWLKYMWSLFYWYTFVSTWIVLPFLSSYVISGHWKIKCKIRQAILENILFYILYTIVGIGSSLIYFWYQNSKFSFLDLLMALGYAFGLFLVIAFMSHGLIDLPRHFYKRTNPQYMMREIFANVSVLKDKLDDLYTQMNQIHQRILVLCSILPEDHISRERAIQIRNEIERDQQSNHRSHHRRLSSDGFRRRIFDSTYWHDSTISVVEDIVDGRGSLHIRNDNDHNETRNEPRYHAISELVRLREQWLDCQRYFIRYDGEWEDLVQTGCQLLDDETDRLEGIMLPKRKIWLMISKAMSRFLAITFGLASIVILWSEISISISNTTGLPASIISSYIDNLVDNGYLKSAVLLSILILSYMTLCMFSSLFKFTFFQRYQLVSKHHTDLPSFLFLTSYSCRLVFSLCYNYLGLLDSSSSNVPLLSSRTQFIQIMGSINLVPFLGSRYYLFVPLLSMFVSIIVFFRLDIKFVSCLGLQPFFESSESFSDSSLDINDEHITSITRENIERGKRLVRQARPLSHAGPSLISLLLNRH